MLRRKSKHKRNTAGMIASVRCGAKTRSGKACNSPAVSGKDRCRMHGGAKGSGAPKGNKNALKHGMYTKENLELMKYLRELARKSREFLERFE